MEGIGLCCGVVAGSADRTVTQRRRGIPAPASPMLATAKLVVSSLGSGVLWSLLHTLFPGEIK